MKNKMFTRIGVAGLLFWLGIATAPLRAGTVADSLKGELVSYQDKELKPFDESKLSGIKYFALYFSAHWCPPCRAFTPELVQWFIREVCVNLTAGKLEFGFMQAVEFENKEGFIPIPVGLALRAS